MAATDLLTLAEARAAINNSDASLDTEIGSYISAVSLRIDGLCGPVVIRTVTGEIHNGGGVLIWPHLTPVASVTSVTESDSGSSLVADIDFVLDRHLGVIVRRSGGSDGRWSAGRSNVAITYEAGRYADTDTVDARFKQAAAIFLSHLWRYEQGQGSATFGGTTEGLGIPSFGTPNAVRDLLQDELRAPVIA